MGLLILLLCAGLAAANGSNDISKGVATLAGAGVTRYRSAIAWGVGATLLGSLLSLSLASTIGTLFTKGILTIAPTPGFALAALIGAGAWVTLASATRLPVSTTHAIVGALIAVGLVHGHDDVEWGPALTHIAGPLLLSVVVAYVLAALATLRIGARRAGFARGPGADVATEQTAMVPIERADVDRLHWLTSGATSFARGLNDTPKIWALGAFALVPGTLTRTELLVIVASGIALGGAVSGVRVARRLGDGVIRLSHHEGFAANAVTAVLVGSGALLGLPMSTTHVATGAISGVAGQRVSRLNGRALRDFAIAWTVTPLTAGLVAALVLQMPGLEPKW